MSEIPNKLPRQFRTLSVVREAVEGDANRFAFALSSEEPADQWFGREILQHDNKSIRQDRLKAGIPLLFNHDRDQHMGVVDGYNIKDGKLRVEGKWSSSDFAQQKKRDYDDGILKDSSVGYLIHKIVRDQAGEYPSGDDTLNVTDWEPMEASLVTIPADPTVGVGRSVGEQEIPVAVEVHRRGVTTAPATEVPASPAAIPTIEVRTVAEETKQPDAGQLEIKRRDAIMALASDKDFAQHVTITQAREAIEKGTSVDEFSQGISRSIIRANQATNVGTAGDKILEEAGKDAKRYSMVRAYRLAIHEQKPSMFSKEDFSFEREISQELHKRTGQAGHHVMAPTAAVRVQTATAAGTGQNPIGSVVTATTTRPDVIPMFRVVPKVIALGAQHLGGLNGIIKFPRQTAAGTAYWLAETAAVPESDIAVDFFTMSPKRLSMQNAYTVELLAQDAVGIENLLANDRDQVIRRAIDAAALLPGTNGAPNGLLGITGLAQVTSSGTALTTGNAMSYNDFLLLQEKVADANADADGNFAWLTTPGVRRVAKATPMLPGNITGPVWPALSYSPTGVEEGPLGYPAAVTTEVPSNFGTNHNLHAVIYGAFSNILIGDWGASELIVDPYTGAGTGTYIVTERLLMDVNVRHIAPFAVCETAAVS